MHVSLNVEHLHCFLSELKSISFFKWVLLTAEMWLKDLIYDISAHVIDVSHRLQL